MFQLVLDPLTNSRMILRVPIGCRSRPVGAAASYHELSGVFSNRYNFQVCFEIHDTDCCRGDDTYTSASMYIGPKRNGPHLCQISFESSESAGFPRSNRAWTINGLEFFSASHFSALYTFFSPLDLPLPTSQISQPLKSKAERSAPARIRRSD
jgi:hypothetical protein